MQIDRTILNLACLAFQDVSQRYMLREFQIRPLLAGRAGKQNVTQDQAIMSQTQGQDAEVLKREARAFLKVRTCKKAVGWFY